MKKFLLISLGLVSFLLIVSLVGCGTSGSDATTTTTSTTTTTTAAEYFPHTDGYIWTYDYITSGQTGTAVMSFEGTHDIGTLETQIHKICAAHPLYPGGGELYYIITDSAALQYGTSSSPTTEGQPYLTFPLTLEASWTYNSLGVIRYCSVISYETVVVPAGTFANCYKVYTTRESGGTVNIWEWFAPDVGLVKNNNISINTGLITATYELTSKNF